MRISDWSSDVCASDLMALARRDKFRNAKGSLPTSKVRLDMQKTMQAHAAVFRTQKLMDEGIEHLNKVIDSFEDVAVSDRSMIWNSDLVETLELDNLLGQALVTLSSRSEEHTSELQSLMRSSYSVFCSKKK